MPDLNPSKVYTNTVQIDVGNNPGEWTLGGYADWTELLLDVEDNRENNIHSAGQVMIHSLIADQTALSASAGGQVNFALNAGPGLGGRFYFLLGTMSGTLPGVALPGGSKLPLNYDGLMKYIMNNYNNGRLGDFRRLLDGGGLASATLDTQTPFTPSAVGLTLHFAFTTEIPYDFQSNPVAIDIVP